MNKKKRGWIDCPLIFNSLLPCIAREIRYPLYSTTAGVGANVLNDAQRLKWRAFVLNMNWVMGKEEQITAWTLSRAYMNEWWKWVINDTDESVWARSVCGLKSVLFSPTECHILLCV